MSIPVERLEPHVAVSAPPITIEVFESLLQCETKSKLYFQGAAETDSEFKNWLRRQHDCFKEEGISRSMSEPHLSKLSNESTGESSQITSPLQPRYSYSWMLWNLRQGLQIESHCFIDHSVS